MKTGILGGTFNPPHLGHKLLLEKIQKRLRLQNVIVIPSNLPPHKTVADNAPEHRLSMTRLAFPEYFVSDMEISRGGTSYTYLTLEELMQKNSDAQLYFICGTDMFVSLESWKYPERIFKNAVMVCAARDKNEYAQLFKYKRLYKKKYNARCKIVIIKPFPVSSSLIREMVNKGENAAKYLDKNVMDYIDENGLYR